MIDAQTVLARWRDWVQAFREARPERLGTSERMCIHLWDALAASQVRVEALERAYNMLSGHVECQKVLRRCADCEGARLAAADGTSQTPAKEE